MHATPPPPDPTSSRAARRSLMAAGALALAAALALSACGSGGDASKSTGSSVPQTGSTDGGSSGSSTSTANPPAEVKVGTVTAASLHSPIAMAVKADDPGHLWIAERAGRVRRVAIEDDGDTLTSTGAPVLDISDQTTTEAERGLLAIAFSRDSSELYASYTDRDGNTRVVAYPVDGDQVDESSPRLLFAVDQPYPNHNGGNIAIGPDGNLWLGLGDGGAANDPEDRAQDPDTPLGKVIRIDPETGDHETVISGVRNPWRWAFDTDGSLWIGDVGQDHHEEIDHLEADQIEGANLGWSWFEASERNPDGSATEAPAGAIGPVFEYPHEDGNCSITGGFAYRGTAIAGLRGAFLFADYCAGQIRAIKLRADGTLDRELDLGIQIERPISFGRDQKGEPYVLSEGGDVVRLIPAS